MMVIGTHELFHLIVGYMLGGGLISICIDPSAGGRCELAGLTRIGTYAPGMQPLVFYHRAFITLAAGYFGSAIIGFVYIVSLTLR